MLSEAGRPAAWDEGEPWTFAETQARVSARRPPTERTAILLGGQRAQSGAGPGAEPGLGSRASAPQETTLFAAVTPVPTE